MSTYTIHKRHTGSYEIRDDEDGEQVARVATFYPGPMVLVEGAKIISPELARTVARVMRRVANEIDREAQAV